MDCPKCGTPSMPGTAHCPDCGHSFRISPEMDTPNPELFYPPRKRDRGRRRATVARDSLHTGMALIRRPENLNWMRHHQFNALILAILFPSFGLWYIREKRYAAAFGTAFSGALGMAALMIRFSVSNFFIGLALSIWIYSAVFTHYLCVSRMFRQTIPFKRSLGITLMISGFVVLFVVLIYTTVFHDYQILQLEQNMFPPNFHRSDYMLMKELSPEEAATIERGDWIVHMTRRVEQISPVIGLPGETVQQVDSRVYINGEDTSEMVKGLNIPILAENYEWHVPDCHYLALAVNPQDINRHNLIAQEFLRKGVIPETYPGSAELVPYGSVRFRVVTTIFPAGHRRVW